MSRPYRVCVVCTGNICRSPMAEIVLRAAVADAGLADDVVVDSAGTDGWHVGDSADPRTLSTLRDGGYDGSSHRARQFQADWIDDRDLVLCADAGHLRAVRRLAPGTHEHVRLLRDFDPAAVGQDLADPYYGGQRDFSHCLEQVEQAVPGVVAHLRSELSR